MFEISDLDLKRIEELAFKELETRRILHSISCSQVLNILLSDFGIKNARALSLMHDIAHHKSEDYLRSYISTHNISLEEGESIYVLLHAPVGAHILRNFIKNCPDNWVNAIRRHTVPHTDMDDLAYALFIADIIEPTRPFISEEERTKVYRMPSMEERMLYTMTRQKGFLNRNNQDHLPCSKKLYDILLQKV